MQARVVSPHVVRMSKVIKTIIEKRTNNLSYEASKLQCDKPNIRSTTEKFMIVGLGNNKSSQTRHSVGLQVLDCLADKLNLDWVDDIDNVAGHFAMRNLDDVSLILLKPQLPMMVNGTSVSKAARHFCVPPENVYLIHDDIAHKIGKITLKDGGCANGHNGVRSVLHALDTEKLTRLKIGIDCPPTKDKVALYLNEQFSPAEQQILGDVLELCLTALSQHMKDKNGLDMIKSINDLAKKVESQDKERRMKTNEYPEKY